MIYVAGLAGKDAKPVPGAKDRADGFPQKPLIVNDAIELENAGRAEAVASVRNRIWTTEVGLSLESSGSSRV